jgi:hypothetical protein
MMRKFACLLAGLMSVAGSLGVSAQTSELFISEYIEGSSNNKAIEIYNGTGASIDLSAGSYKLEYYFNGSSTVGLTINLTGTVANGDVYVVAQGSANATILAQADQTNSSSWFNGDDAIVLRKDTTVIDVIGQVGNDPGTEWGSGTQSTADNTLVRNDVVCAGDTNTGDTFTPSAEWAGFAQDTLTDLGTHTADCGGGSLTLSIGDVSLAEGDSGTTTFTFTVSLSEPAGAGGVSFDIATADGTAQDDNPGTEDNDYVASSLTGQSIAEGDSSYNFDVTVNGDATVEASETFFVNVTNLSGADAGDAQGQGTISNDDVTLTAISAIQGNGRESPLEGASVTTEGIVTAVVSNGFFLQSAPADYDADPTTSEGIFVFTSSTPTVVVGDAAQVTGTVSEFVSSNADYFALTLTELTSPTVLVLSTGNSLPDPVDLNLDLAETEYGTDTFERYEGMRVSSDDLDVVAPSDGFIDENDALATSNGDFFAVLGGVARPAREEGLHTLELNHSSNPFPGYAGPVFDGNPERLRVNSDGQGAGTIQLDVDAGDAVTNVIGVMDSYYGNYSILPDPVGGGYTGPEVVLGANIVFARAPESDEITVAGANLLRLYDDVNDAGGDVVMTTVAYQNRIAKAAAVICQAMNAPDIIGTVEVENLNVLNALAAAIDDTADSGCATAPNYVAYLVEGNDQGGIDVGFLVRTAEVAEGTPRVSVNSVTQEGASTEFLAFDGSNSGSLLNDRPPLVLEATVNAANGASEDITVIANHLRSLGSVNSTDAGSNGYPTEGARVRAKRHQQAEFLANLVQARQLADPDERIVLVGDFNAFEFNDGYGHSMGTITGIPAADGETVVDGDGDDLVDPDLINLTLVKAQADRYSYSFGGNAQTLDHALVNQAVNADFVVDVDHARINADFIEEDYDNFSVNDDEADDELTRISDHDPVIAYLAAAAFNSADVSLDVSATSPRRPVEGGSFVVTVANAIGPDSAQQVYLSLEVDLPTSALTVTPSGALDCNVTAINNGDGSLIECSLDTLAPFSQETVTVAIGANEAADGQTVTLTGSSGAASTDADPGNDDDSASIEFQDQFDLCFLGEQGCLTGAQPPVEVAGDSAVVDLEVGNSGPDAGAGVLTFQIEVDASRLSVAAGSGCGSPSNVGPGVAAVTCSLGTLPGDSSLAYGFAVDVTGLVGPASIAWTATVSGSGDGDTGNNTITGALTLPEPQGTDFYADVLPPRPGVRYNDARNFKVTLGNAGPLGGIASTATITVAAPGATGFPQLDPRGWSCSRSGTPSAHSYTCSRTPALVPGMYMNLLLTFRPVFGQSGTSITVSADHQPVAAEFIDPTPENNQDSDVYQVPGSSLQPIEPPLN